MFSFSILTLGCKVNSYESEALINELKKAGYLYKPFNEKCDIYIINTCTVTSTSDQKSRQMIRSAKRKNPDSLVVAMGCFTQLNPSVAANLADIVVGSNNKLQIVSLIKSYLENKRQITLISDVLNKPKYEEMKINRLNTHTRGFIKIQDGCENYCSYCAIPYSRGKIRSRNADNIILEINELVNSGVKEIIISGINTGTYGQDLSDMNLAKLIERIMKETSLYRLRLSSIELKEITDELIDTIYKYKERIAHHFHIPLQGGSDTVLQRMHRKYNTNEYYETILKLRNKFGDVALTTDVLAGFVGETEEEFNELCSFIKKVGFYEMHIFPYSRRKGTEADEMSGHLDEKIKNIRCHELLKIAEELKIEYLNRQIGKTFKVIVENKKNDFYHGHTTNYLDLYFNGKELKENDLIDVEVIEYKDGIVFGKVVNHE